MSSDVSHVNSNLTEFAGARKRQGTEVGGFEQSQREGEGRVSELTPRAIVLGALLSAVLAAANAYLGLFAGMTVSASIPAAVVSMGILKAVKGSLLENNLVQTAASAGESAAAGAIFTLPALILLGAWARFDYWLTFALVGLGGILGVLFTIVLRRALVVEGDLRFPEGVATAAVLKAGYPEEGAPGAEVGAGEVHAEGANSEASLSLRRLLQGALFGAGAKALESGLSLSRSVVEGAASIGSSTFYFGLGVSPALVAVGSIVGIQVASLVFVGGAINWLCILPFFAEPQEGMTALDVAWQTWSSKTRYLGVGAMTLGGLAALFEVRFAIKSAVAAAFGALNSEAGARRPVLSERDLPAKGVLLAALFCVLPLYGVFLYLTGELALSALLAALVLVFSFLFSAVAAYMAGLVGSSNNPVSGVTIATILFSSLLLSYLGVSVVAPGLGGAAGPAAAILVGSVVCTAAAIGGDNMQDLKAGHILGATPYRQQIMQLVGVIAAALVMGPVLQLLLEAYGFGAPTELKPESLRAPQATLMASVAAGVFGGGLPWGFFFSGVGIGAVVIAVDAWLVKRQASFRAPVLAVALGLYLPWEMSVPVLVGGLIPYVKGLRSKKRSASGGEAQEEGSGASLTLLTGAGLITGEALMGILLAVFVVTLGGLDWLKVAGGVESSWLALLLLGGAVILLGRKR